MIKIFSQIFDNEIKKISYQICAPVNEKIKEIFETLDNLGFLCSSGKDLKNIKNLPNPDLCDLESILIGHLKFGYFMLDFDFYKFECTLSKLERTFDPVVNHYAKLAEDRCIKKNDLTTEEIIYNSVQNSASIEKNPFIDLVDGEKINFKSSIGIVVNRKGKNELYKYHNQNLMNELNEFMVSVKIHLHNIEQGKHNHHMPSISDIDEMTSKLMVALRKDKEPLVKR